MKEMERQADIYEVWAGFRFQCQDCHTVLEPGDKFARLNDDSSAVLCIPCLERRQRKPVASAEPADLRPERPGHRHGVEWMEYDD